MEIELQGGVANAGSVTRVDDHVLRPGNPHTETVHRFLRHLAAVDFTGAPVPVGVDSDGRERLEFIEGEVPIPQYPRWAQADEALASIARLVRGFHEASAAYPQTATDSWSAEMAEARGGPVISHNDVCLENVVFRDGLAVALLDFDFAAPGHVETDLASFARMCVPIDDETNRTRLGWEPADLPARLRLVADEYGLDAAQRVDLLSRLDRQIARGGEFVRRRVEAGDPNFITMWNAMGGAMRFDRRRAWWAVEAPEFVASLS